MTREDSIGKKILIIRFSSIGDIVLTTPVIRCLKKQLTGSEIHYLTKKQFLPVLRNNPFIDKLWLYDHDFKSLIPQLKSQGFDFILDLHNNPRTGFVKSQLRRPSASFPKLNIEKWLMVNFKWNLLPDIHIVDRYFKTVRTLKVNNDGQGLDYFISPEDEVDLNALPEIFQQGFVAMVIGGKHVTKIFPPEKVAEVCIRLARPVILLGGREDFERGELVRNRAGKLVFNGCGKFSLNQSASLVRQADVVITNDTGLMHIAAAFHKPIVSLWGNTIPAFGMYPYLPEAFQKNSLMAEVSGLCCRPCSKLGYPECPRKHFRCMNNIDVEPILEFVRNFGN